MAWARNTTSGILTHAGTVRDYWQLRTNAPARTQFAVGLTRIADQVMLCVRPSGDGRSCFEVGVIGTQLLIRKLTFGSIGSTLAAATHTIAAATAYRVRVRLDSDSAGNATITTYAGVSDSSEVSCTITTDELLAYSARVGVASSVNNATVNWFEMSTLVDQITTFGEMGLAVIGGSVYRSLRDRVWEAVPGGTSAFPNTCRVSMATLNGFMFIVGGGKARQYDPIGNAVSDYNATSGSLPGATTSGTTTATLITEHLGGLVFADGSGNDVVLYGTAIAEPYNLNSGERLYGSAWVRGVGRNVTVGDPILALEKGPNNTLFIGCTNSDNFMLGDPYRGTDEIITAAETFGCSGPDAALRVSGPNGEDMLLMHSPEGLCVCPQGGSPVNISAGILSKYLTFARDQRQNRTVVLIRDPGRQRLMAFIDAGGSDSVHLFYDETIGGYRKNRPGWYPQSIPVRICAAALIRGTAILGTDDGRLVRFDESATNDLGSTVESMLTMSMVDVPPTDNDVIVRRPRVLLGLESSPLELTFYGGVTPEQAYDVAARTQLWRETFSPKQFRGTASARAPFITAVLRTTATSQRAVFEGMEADVTTARMSTALGWTARDVAAGFCTPNLETSIPTSPTAPPAPPPPPPPPPPAPPTAPGGGVPPTTFVPPGHTDGVPPEVYVGGVSATGGVIPDIDHFIVLGPFDPGFGPEGAFDPEVDIPFIPQIIITQVITNPSVAGGPSVVSTGVAEAASSSPDTGDITEF